MHEPLLSLIFDQFLSLYLLLSSVYIKPFVGVLPILDILCHFPPHHIHFDFLPWKQKLVETVSQSELLCPVSQWIHQNPASLVFTAFLTWYGSILTLLYCASPLASCLHHSLPHLTHVWSFLCCYHRLLETESPIKNRHVISSVLEAGKSKI